MALTNVLLYSRAQRFVGLVCGALGDTYIHIYKQLRGLAAAAGYIKLTVYNAIVIRYIAIERIIMKIINFIIKT